MLNKHNLEIASLCSKEQSRFALNGILVTPDCTVETDGHQLVMVTTPKDVDTTNFPSKRVNSDEITKSFTPFILGREDALEIKKALPKKTYIPCALNAAITLKTETAEYAEVLVDDDKIFTPKKVDGRFPDYQRIMPSITNNEFEISFDAELLAKVFKAAAAFKSDDHGPKVVKLRFKGGFSNPLRIDATNEKGQEFVALAMPCRE